MLRRLSVAAVVLVSLAACSMAREFPSGKSVLAVDFRVFWDAANSSHPYALGAYSVPYPPTALIWFQPLAYLDFWTGYALWASVALVAFALTGWRLFPGTVMVLRTISPIVVRGAMLGQTPLLLTTALFLGFSIGTIAPGIAIGLVAGIKPQIVFLAPLVFLARREWRVIAAAAATISATVIIELVYFGPALWANWVAMLPRFHQTLVDDQVLKNCISFGGLAEGYGIPCVPIFLATLGAAAYLAYRLAPKRRTARAYHRMQRRRGALFSAARCRRPRPNCSSDHPRPHSTGKHPGSDFLHLG